MAARFEVEQHAASFGYNIHHDDDTMMIKMIIISIVPPPVNEAGQGTHLIRIRIVKVATVRGGIKKLGFFAFGQTNF